MVSKCANPACSVPFRSLRSGKLIRVESKGTTATEQSQLEFRERLSTRRVEFFWLCDDCSSKGLMFQKDGSLTAPTLLAGAAGANL